MTLLEFGLGKDLGLDQLIFREAPGAIGTLAPGRMAPTSAALFFILGLVLVSDERKRRNDWPMTILVILAAVPALASGLGYLYQVPNHYGFGYLNQMALHTAWAFVALVCGLLFLRADRGFIALFRNPDSSGLFARRLVPIVVSLPFLIEWLQRVFEQKGFLEPGFSSVLFTLFYSLALASLILWTSLEISGLEAIRRTTEQNLRESEARYHVLVEQAPEAIVVFDLKECRVLDANAHAERLFGCTREHLKKVGLLPFYTAKQADGRPPEESLKLNSLAALEGREVQFERTIQRPDGETRICEVRLVALPWSGQRVVRGSFLDITERKQIELERDHYFKLVHTASDLMVIADPNGCFKQVNPACLQALGYTEQELLAHPFIDFVHPDDRQATLDEISRQIRRGSSLNFENRYLCKDGSVRWLSWRAVFVEKEGTTYATARDMTERKQVEAERARLQFQLQQTQKMESLGILASGVAHDMNNVLGAILGLASSQVEARSERSTLRRTFETIIKAAERGGKMVKGLLSFARQTTAEEQVLDVNELIRDGARLLERTTLSRIAIDLDLDDGLRPVMGDAGALSTAMVNLYINAVDAMPEGGTLRVRTRNVAEDQIEILVEDTGTGMTKEVLDKALDPFFTTKEPGKGTGLGLSMVFSTIKAHRGQMEIFSEPHRGTRIHLRLPACQSGGFAETGPDVQDSGSSLPSMKILVIDDDELIRTSIEMLLETLGHAVTCTSSGEEALSRLEAGYVPDLVILDMNMPGLGGRGTLPRLRALHPSTPVLLATGRADQTALDLVEGDEHTTLLAKPFSMETLKAGLHAARMTSAGKA
ncbi:MAG TPA: PAS domain S-box protein [Geothrix sp.]|nr:PAS domain S-box protein [Geothrix sp.]